MLAFMALAVLAFIAVLFAVPTLGATLLALVYPKSFLGALAILGNGTAACAAFGLGVPILLDHKSEGGGGDAALLDKIDKGITALDGRTKAVEDEVKLVKSAQEKFLDEPDRWPAAFKAKMEELTKLKQVANDSQANVSKLERTISELHQMLRRDVRGSFGDPIERISASPELRSALNIAVRMAMNHNGDMERIVRGGYDKELVKRALGEDASPGSTLINAQLAAEIYDTLAMFGSWNTLGVRRLGTKLTKYPVKTVRPVANFILTESDTINDDTNKAGTSVDLEAEVMAVLLNVSLQLLQDAEFDVTADVLDDFREAYNYRLDYAAFAADGSADATNGGMTGLFNFGTAIPAAAGNIKVENTDLEDWVNAIVGIDLGAAMRPTAWWMHPFILARALLVRDENGRSIFQTALEAPSPGAIGSILRSPVIRVPAAPSTNAANAKIAVFGERQGYVVGTRQDFVFEASDHHKWNTLQRSFRAYGRAGTKGRRANAFSVLTLPAA